MEKNGDYKPYKQLFGREREREMDVIYSFSIENFPNSQKFQPKSAGAERAH